jgi:hypothetical protein
MADSFYYQDHENTIRGPLAPAALKQLANDGVIDESTLVRKGEEGPWYQAGKVPGLIPAPPKPAEAEPFPSFETDAPDRTRRTIKKAGEQAEKVAAKLWFLDLKFSQFFTPKLVGATWALFLCLVVIGFLTSTVYNLATMTVLRALLAIIGELLVSAFAVVFSRVILELFLVTIRIAEHLESLKHLEYLKHLETHEKPAL